MKSTFKYSLLFFTFVCHLFHSARTNSNVDESNFQYEKKFKKVMESHGKVISHVIYFSDHVGDLDKNPNQILIRKSALEDDINTEISRLKSIENTSDKELVDSVVMYYDTLRKSISSEYDVAINLRMNMDYSHSHVHSFLTFLDEADRNIMKAEEFLYKMELRYAKRHEFSLPKEEEDIRKNILKNDAVIKYHNKLFLEFYKIYTIENDFLKLSAVRKDSTVKIARKNFADDLFHAEEVVQKLGTFDGDAALFSTIKVYFHYLRSENFKNIDFYNEYIKNVEKKHGKNHADTQKHDQTLRVAQSKLSTPAPQQKKDEEFVKGLTLRDQIVEKVEDASFKFLYEHSPSFD
jgi:hypothetical protein